MNKVQRRLGMLLINPTLPCHVRRGDSLDVEVQITASGQVNCRLEIAYDRKVLISTDPTSDTRDFAVGDVAGTATWRLKACTAVERTTIAIEAKGEVFTQRIHFFLEVRP